MIEKKKIDYSFLPTTQSSCCAFQTPWLIVLLNLASNLLDLAYLKWKNLAKQSALAILVGSFSEYHLKQEVKRKKCFNGQSRIIWSKPSGISQSFLDSMSSSSLESTVDSFTGAATCCWGRGGTEEAKLEPLACCCLLTDPLPLGVVKSDKSGLDKEAAILLRPSLELFLLPRAPLLFANGSNF